MYNMHYKPSIYDVMKISQGNVGIGTNTPQNSLHVAGSLGLYKDGITPVFQTSSSGLEIGRNLTFANRSLGLGIETEVLGSNAVFVLNENIPRSYIHIDDPSNGSNPWVAAFDADLVNPNYQEEVTRGLFIGKDGTVYATTEVYGYGNTTIRNPDGTIFSIPDLNTSNIGSYAIVSSFQSSGTPNWHRVFATSNVVYNGEFAYAPSICCDTLGNSYVLGDTQMMAVVFDSNLTPWWSSPNTVNANGTGGFLVKYDVFGNPLWVSFVTASTLYLGLFGNAIDETSNAMYVVGCIYKYDSEESLTFYNANGSVTSTQIEMANYDGLGLVIKYDLNGNVQWVNTINGINSDYVTQVAVDEDHNVVFASMLDSANGASSVEMQSQDSNHLLVSGTDSYIVGKYDSQGNAVWGISIAPSIPGYYGPGVVQNICTFGNDVYVVTGVDDVYDLIITNSDGTTITLTDFSYSHVYIKFNADGMYQRHTHITGGYFAGNDRKYGLRTGLSFDKYGNMYICPFIESNHIDPILIYNSDGSCNVLNIALEGDVYIAPVLKFNQDGIFMHKVATLTNANYTIPYNVAVDHVHNRLYVTVTSLTFGYSTTFEVYNREDQNVYSFQNIDTSAGFLVALDLDSGNIVKPGITLKLPAQETDHFHKDIFLTTTKTTPYTAHLHLENRDHTYKYMPITLDHSNVTVQKSFRWTSNAWISTSQFEPTAQGVNLVDYYYGDQFFTATGSNYIGANIAWQKKTHDNKLAFRVTTKCSLASDEEIAYRQFEALVSPIANENSNMPYGIVSAEVGDIYGPSFSNLYHTITRHSDHSVDLKVHWDTSSINYVGNIELHVLATTRLGDISFHPLHG